MVTIIVPIYNAEKYLDMCIKSILEQSYLELEIILINDGSTDNSLEICKRYASEDKRIKIINKNNEGVNSARNAGLDLSSGDYIAFVDSDDYIEKNMIEIMVKNIIEKNADISICGYNVFFDDTKKFKKSDVEKVLVEMTNKEVLNLIFSSNKINGFLWNKVFKRNLLNKLYLNDNIDICEDLYIISKLMKDERKICYTSESLYNYRNNENSATRNIDNLFYKDGTLKYVEIYSKIITLFEGDEEIVYKINIRMVKTVLETYYLILKNKYNNEKINKYIFYILKKNKKIYLTSKLVSLKFKIAFIIFYIILKLKNNKY